MTLKTELSVILAINRFDRFTHLAIESVLKQSYKNFRFIIVCNGEFKDDISLEISSNYSDNRIFIVNSNIPSLAASLNLGLQFVDTKYVARMDSDDISLENRFEEQIRFLEENDDYSVVGCKVRLIDDHNNFLPDSFLFCETHNEIMRVLPIRNPMCHPALIFRTSVLLENGGYRYHYYSEDHELFLSLLYKQRARFHNINKELFYYRRHSSQITSQSFYKAFSEISPFLMFWFMKTFNLKFLIGLVNVFPLSLFLKSRYRMLKRRFN